MTRLLLLWLVFAASGLSSTAVIFADSTARPVPNVNVSDGRTLWRSNVAGRVDLPPDRAYKATRYGFETTEFRTADTTLRITLKTVPVLLQSLRVIGGASTGALNPNSATRVVIPQPGESPARALEQASAVWIPQTAYPGRSQTLSILGHRTRHTLVMIDGVPMNDNGSSFDLASIPADFVERIEVLPMGGGTGGSGEIGGVVNLVTRKPGADRRNRASLSTGGGSYGERSAALGLEGGIPAVYGSLNLSATGADNDFPYDNPLAPPDFKIRRNNDYRERTIDSAVQLPNAGISAWFAARGFDKGLPGPVNTISMYDRCHANGDSYTGKASWSATPGDWELDVDALVLAEQTDYDNRFSTSQVKRFHTRNQTHRWETGAGLGRMIFGWDTGLDAGLRLDSFRRKNLLTGDSDPTVRARNLYAALHIGREWDLGRFHPGLNLSGRTDRVDYDRTPEKAPDPAHAAEFNLDASLRREGILTWTLSAQRARTFSLPSFQDLFWKGDTMASGNPDLRPETAQTLRLALDLICLGQNAGFVWRRDRIDNLIYWHNSPSGWTPDNLAAAEIINCETTCEIHPIEDLDADFSWVRTFSADRTGLAGIDGRELTYTPASLVHAGLSWRTGILTWRTGYRRVGKRWPTRDHAWGALPVYETVDAGLAATVTRGDWTLTGDLDAKNLLNRHDLEYDAEPQPGTRMSFRFTIERVF
jgi:vitamin B12 transporter